MVNKNIELTFFSWLNLIGETNKYVYLLGIARNYILEPDKSVEAMYEIENLKIRYQRSLKINKIKNEFRTGK